MPDDAGSKVKWWSRAALERYPALNFVWGVFGVAIVGLANRYVVRGLGVPEWVVLTILLVGLIALFFYERARKRRLKR